MAFNRFQKLPSWSVTNKFNIGLFTLQFSDSFFNYRKIWFHVNGVNNCFIVLCIFSAISFWHQSFFWNQNWLGFKKILEIKLLEESFVSKRGWRRNKGKSISQLNKHFMTSSYFDLSKWLKQTNTDVQYFLFLRVKLLWLVKQQVISF